MIPNVRRRRSWWAVARDVSIVIALIACAVAIVVEYGAWRMDWL